MVHLSISLHTEDLRGAFFAAAEVKKYICHLKQPPKKPTKQTKKPSNKKKLTVCASICMNHISARILPLAKAGPAWEVEGKERPSLQSFDYFYGAKERMAKSSLQASKESV